MKNFISFLAIVFLLAACNSGDKIPNVSNIKIDLVTERFDKDFFALPSKDLNKKYPEFMGYFYEFVLGASQDDDADVKTAFAKSYQQLHDSVQKIFGDFTKYEAEIKQGLQFVKHYFPEYKLPTKIVTFLGPLDASFKTSFGLQGDIITNNAIGIGLQLHMGQNFSYYQSAEGQQLYPQYISANFTPATISVNAMRNIVDDMFPEKLDEKPLVQQMVEKGKRLYLLRKFLPKVDEYLLIGFTKTQWQQSTERAKQIWAMFSQNGSLQSIDDNIIKTYIGASPKTQELGDASPGNIGAFAGWQIVNKYMKENSKTILPQLMAMDADALFQAAKYKP
jgi:hypothetical protein